MQLEQHNLSAETHSCQSTPPYSAVDYQAVHHAEQPSLPTLAFKESGKVMDSTGQIFHRYAQETICVSCRQQVITKTKYRITGSTWLMCCVVFGVGGFLGCCLIPFCLKSCKSVIHKCPQCNTVLGRRSVM